MSDPVPSSAIYDATVGGLSVIVITGGSTGDVLTRQSDGTYAPAAVSALPLSGGTLTGQLTNSTNGAASTPPERLTGTWFTGGSATTTKPQFLIEPTGTTSTGWSTSGTGFGVNAASGFGGNLLDLQTAGASQMLVQSNGFVKILNGLYVGATSGANNIIEVASFGFAVNSASYVGFASSTNAGGTKDVRFSRNAAGIVQIGTTSNNALGSLLLADLTASGLLCAGVYTFATVPSASSNTGKFLRISDRAQKHAYSDGTNWRFFGDDAIIS